MFLNHPGVYSLIGDVRCVELKWMVVRSCIGPVRLCFELLKVNSWRPKSVSADVAAQEKKHRAENYARKENHCSVLALVVDGQE